MRRKSKLMEKLKEEEIQKFRKMTPQQRINLEISHCDLIRSIFGAGLRLRGFSEKEINSLWKKENE